VTTVVEPPLPVLPSDVPRGALRAAPSARPATPSLFTRPARTTGLGGWLTTVDHKKIGVLYGITAFVFFLVGGAEALLIRLQLATPNGKILSAQTYNQVFTMHGTTMIFMVVMPLSAAFFNYLLPLQIGARDVAFPRLNAFSYWLFLSGGLFMYSSFLLGGAPNGGWFGYSPNTSITYSPGHNIDYWLFGLLIMGIGSTVSAVNFITTIINLRAPGMRMLRMPVFSWMTFVASFLLLFAMPVITIALFLLMFDRQWGTHFFDPLAGGDAVLWQHLFWLFGHPEVYILVLPAMGVVSEILPVFSRKPLFGYPVVVFSGIAIGFMGWGVWVHHMFAVGLGPVATSAFSISTMLIAVPTGVKIFNWLATMWGGRLRFQPPLLFAIGFVTMFTIGGLSGVTHALVPADRQQTDTYYVVAHFHYVLFGGSILGLFGGIYYWYPKIFGRMLDERLGKLHFWMNIIGFNLAFGPMHILGLQGMPRRIYTYPANMGFNFWNAVSTVGAFTIAAATAVFIYNVWRTQRHGSPAPPDPWDARTLEWMIPSPAPAYNFREVPLVSSVDEYWHRKYGENEEGRVIRVAEPDDIVQKPLGPGEHAHMPSPSYYPLVAALGLPVIAYGQIYRTWAVSAIGVIVLLAGIYGWAIEPSTEPEEPEEPGAGEPGGEERAAEEPEEGGRGGLVGAAAPAAPALSAGAVERSSAGDEAPETSSEEADG